MRFDLHGRARAIRYALPTHIGQILGEASPAQVARYCRTLHSKGLAGTLGHFPTNDDNSETVMAANMAVLAALSEMGGNAYLSVKAPQLGFDRRLIEQIAKAAG